MFAKNQDIAQIYVTLNESRIRQTDGWESAF